MATKSLKQWREEGGVLCVRSDVVIRMLLGVEGREPILLSLVNAVLEEAGLPPAGSVTMLNAVRPGVWPGNRLLICDSICVDDRNRLFIIEVQNKNHRGFRHRLIVSGGREKGRYVDLGVRRRGSSRKSMEAYALARNVIVIALVDFNPFDEPRGIFTHYPSTSPRNREWTYPENILPMVVRMPGVPSSETLRELKSKALRTRPCLAGYPDRFGDDALYEIAKTTKDEGLKMAVDILQTKEFYNNASRVRRFHNVFFEEGFEEGWEQGWKEGLEKEWRSMGVRVVCSELAYRISDMPGNAQEQVRNWVENPDRVMELLQTAREAKSWEDFRRRSLELKDAPGDGAGEGTSPRQVPGENGSLAFPCSFLRWARGT